MSTWVPTDKFKAYPPDYDESFSTKGLHGNSELESHFLPAKKDSNQVKRFSPKLDIHLNTVASEGNPIIPTTRPTARLAMVTVWSESSSPSCPSATGTMTSLLKSILRVPSSLLSWSLQLLLVTLFLLMLLMLATGLLVHTENRALF